MAKTISISDDDGVTWYSLPGSEGSFSNEAEAIDDTILGQTFSSSEIGLVGWSVSSNGIFKGYAGYLAELKKPGTPTTMTAESTTLVSGKTYQITDTTRRVIDRTATVTIDDNGSPVAASNILNVDYLFGKVTFVASYTPTTPVTFDADYIPMVTLGRGNTYNLTMNAEAIDETDFQTAQGNSGTRVYIPGLRTVSLEIGGIFSATDDLKTELTNRNELIIDIDPAGDGQAVARGFFKLATTSQSGAVGALEEETVNFELTVPVEETNPSVEIPFNWQFINTTLSNAIQLAITSWVGELNTYEVQYLPQGTTGNSPLDGIEGDCIFTDISLSGGLSNMNVFTIEMMGTGGYTEV